MIIALAFPFMTQANVYASSASLLLLFNNQKIMYEERGAPHATNCSLS